ncbi:MULTISPECIES: MarR family winged helix-turn-helix transcriptional regulator [unclassified Sporosarcina]|uniref:MarR family winged helix-turn-helix transcriptional regulator n=1 Tax=unclassified Sporosarcina TaxID=2647733 RepID=UPI000C16B48C|nr:MULTISPECIES: MarR family transcriptional regulator [unclassified Sporosarcina]PID06435.1 MarR family transcriptional regulator [Sporosarcina sp. P30]PID09629.1 MarR family transcriptional regulator [Sporosarcina sp. P31]PID13206.1 MarR family transcriptional regulator [Sporosarcina sp. P32b]
MKKDFSTLDKQLCFAVYETAGEFTKLYANVLKPFGLTYPQYLVLLALWEQDGITMKELGEQVGLGTGTLTPMISRMQEKGWLRKERSIEDERKVYVTLEKKAQNEKNTIIERVNEEIQLCNIGLLEYEELMARLNELHGKLKERTKL